MKKIFNRIIICLITLLPFFACKAINSLDLDEVKSGYSCYIISGLTIDKRYPVYTSRAYGAQANIYTDPDFASENALPQCLNWQNLNLSFGETILEENSCKANLYNAKYIEGSYTYDSWSSQINNSSTYNEYTGSAKDCFAAYLIAAYNYADFNADTMLVEVANNTDIYDSDSINYFKSITSVDLSDNHEMCYAITPGVMGSLSSQYLTYFFGHPQYTVTLTSEDIVDDGKIYFSGDNITIGMVADFSQSYHLDPNNAVHDNDIVIDAIPRIGQGSTVIDAAELSEMDYDDYMDRDTYPGVFILKKDGQLITNSSDCFTYVQDGASTIDTTVEDPNAVIIRDFKSVSANMSKSKAIDSCSTGEETSEYKCYKYTFLPHGSRPMYNTTVWTNKQLDCGFEETNWTFQECKDAKLNHTQKQCKSLSPPNEGNICYNITNTGYNGMADFYIKGTNAESEFKCQDLYGFHIIYRVITIAVPILAIFFITFDFVKSIIIGDPKKIAKVREKSIKRLIVVVILFLLPIIISMLVNSLSKNGKIRDDSMLKCVIKGK